MGEDLSIEKTFVLSSVVKIIISLYEGDSACVTLVAFATGRSEYHPTSHGM